VLIYALAIKNRHQLPKKCFNYGLRTAAAGQKPFLALGMEYTYVWKLPLNFNADLEAYLIWVQRFAQGQLAADPKCQVHEMLYFM